MSIAVAFLQGQLAVVFLLILVLVAIVAVVLFFGLFSEAVRRNPNRPGSSDREEQEERRK
jgi:uncharacterized membrane protein